ncbi:MAG: DUF4249 domain-containing protein [Ignavibacteria bacterium]|jgi:hypothetical protein
MTINLKNYIKKILMVFICSIPLFNGCEDVIKVDLNEVEPQIVIEGEITDQPGPYKVTITQTSDFYSPGIYDKISGAEVTIENNGNIELLTEKEPGVYYTGNLETSYNEEYRLAVNVGNLTYTANTTLEYPLIIDSIQVTEKEEENILDENKRRIYVYLQDNPGKKDYAKIKVAFNGVYEKIYFLYTDRLIDGNYVQVVLLVDDEDNNINKGDTITVEVKTINEDAYNYYLTLYDVLAINDEVSLFDITNPANPETNLSNGALGIFGAYSISKESVIVE